MELAGIAWQATAAVSRKEPRPMEKASVRPTVAVLMPSELAKRSVARCQAIGSGSTVLISAARC
eukprot:3249173-Lingulodinium_polyedra.AAC.1